MNSKDMNVDSLLRHGELLLFKGLVEDAANLFAQAVRLSPKCSTAYLCLGRAFWYQDKIRDASTCYIKAIEFAEKAEPTCREVGDFLRSVGRSDETVQLHRIYEGIHELKRSFSEKRLLAVYDLSVQPYSVGDLIAFQAGAMALNSMTGGGAIDVCIIRDPDRIPLDPVFSRMHGNNNSVFNLLTLLPVVQLNPKLGSLFLFNSFDDALRFVDRSEREYVLWPTREQLNAQTYTYYEIIKTVDRMHRAKQCLPEFLLPGALSQWVETFFERNVGHMLPVTVNLRNNPQFHPERNSNVPAWIDFFSSCRSNFPVVFIVVCSQSEVVPEIRNCPNVVIAKDHNSALEHDLALIMSAAFHLGASSGPATVPIFSSKPYSMLNCGSLLSTLNLYEGSVIRESEMVARFSWANDLQRLILERESREILNAEFERIWTSRDWTHWAQSVSSGRRPCVAGDAVTWLR